MPNTDLTTDTHKLRPDPLAGLHEEAAGGSVGDSEARTGASIRNSRAVRLGLKTGAVTVVTSIVLAAALHGSTTTASQPNASPATEPQAAVTGAQLPDASDRAIAAARADRSSERISFAAALADPEPEVVGKRYTTVDLRVRTKPDDDAKVVAVLDSGDRVTITDAKEEGWRQVVYKDKTRWVKSQYLSKDKPKPKPKGPSSAPCSSGSGGSGMESGLTGNAVKVHRAVCAEFPSVSTYGGLRGSGGNHGTGHAVDIMVSGDSGDAIAAYVRSHASELGVTEVIWQQRIWTTQRASEGWRHMSDRGSTTANHFDHVHVTVG